MKQRMRTNRLCNRSGFTLMELMIVAIILAVIAGLAIPGYQTMAERARRQEAIDSLIAIKEAQMRFHVGSNTFTTTMTQLDINPNLPPPGGGPRHFTYALTAAAAATFTATATRDGAVNCGVGCTANCTVTINQAGAIGGTC